MLAECISSFVSKLHLNSTKELLFDVILHQVSFLTLLSINGDTVVLFRLKRKDEIVFSISVYWQM